LRPIVYLLSFVLVLPAPFALGNDFCRGGVHADGVVDFSGAPAGSTAPYTAPVRGIPGLKATITPPPGSCAGCPSSTFGPSETTITFSRPVKGLTVRMATVLDRFSSTYTVTVKRTISQPFPGIDFPIAQDQTSSGGDILLHLSIIFKRQPRIFRC
jgi:hypothetical protein